MKPIFTTVNAEANVMTYGIWDRLVHWAVYRLNEYHENRTENKWYEANNPKPQNPRKPW